MMFRAAILIGMICVSFGCAHSHVDKVAAIDGDAQARTIALAPRDGMYHVVLTRGNHYVKTRLFDADQYVRRGDVLGFRHNDDGAMVAIAGDQEIKLGPLPPRTTNLMWFHKSKTPTQFAKEAGKLIEAAEKVAVVSAIIAADAYSGGGDCNFDLAKIADSSPAAHRHHHRR